MYTPTLGIGQHWVQKHRSEFPSLYSGSPSSSTWLSLLVYLDLCCCSGHHLNQNESLLGQSHNRWVLHHLATKLSSSVDRNESSKLLEESPDKVVGVYIFTIYSGDLDSRAGARQNSPVQWHKTPSIDKHGGDQGTVATAYGCVWMPVILQCWVLHSIVWYSWLLLCGISLTNNHQNMLQFPFEENNTFSSLGS